MKFIFDCGNILRMETNRIINVDNFSIIDIIFLTVGNSGFILNDITPLSIAKVIKTVSELSNIEEYSKLSRQQIVDNYDVKRRFRELKNIILKG